MAEGATAVNSGIRASLGDELPAVLVVAWAARCKANGSKCFGTGSDGAAVRGVLSFDVFGDMIDDVLGEMTADVFGDLAAAVGDLPAASFCDRVGDNCSLTRYRQARGWHINVASLGSTRSVLP